MITKGKRVKIAYDLSIDGRLITSVGSAKPLRYIHGKKEISAGLQKALHGLKVGERKAFVLAPKDAYGPENPKSFMEIPRARFPKKDHFVGKEITSLKNGKFLATVKEVRSETLVLNFNHPFAGKKLHYDVVVVGIEGESGPVAKKVAL